MGNELVSLRSQLFTHLNHIIQRSHYWLRLKDHLVTKIPVAFLNLFSGEDGNHGNGKVKLDGTRSGL